MAEKDEASLDMYEFEIMKTFTILNTLRTAQLSNISIVSCFVSLHLFL